MSLNKQTLFAILVAALGYFVDVYDLVLFSVLRVDSLKDLGVGEADLLKSGIFLLNAQLVGLLVGGVVWGILGDKRGRLSVLFGSIVTYSIANIANAFVHSVESYAVWRFIAGVGLAGELGAGITLVSELMPKEKRGWGTTIISTIGVSGALFAATIGGQVYWRTAYVIGGLMGVALLTLRIAVSESGMFESAKNSAVQRGNFLMIFKDKARFVRYVACIVIGMPTWYVAGILMTLSPELAKNLGAIDAVTAGAATIATYAGITAGDLASGIFSQLVKSRKRTLALFVFGCAVSCFALLTFAYSAYTYYMWLVIIGFFAGYWCVFVTTAAEQFGTNLRATVATTVPNIVRGSAVVMTILFQMLIPYVGVVASAKVVGMGVFVLALVALLPMRETFHADLAFLEEDKI